MTKTSYPDWLVATGRRPSTARAYARALRLGRPAHLAHAALTARAGFHRAHGRVEEAEADLRAAEQLRGRMREEARRARLRQFRPDPAPDPEAVLALFPPGPVRRAVALGALLGLRANDIVSARWSWYDPVARTLLLPDPKGGRPLLLPVPDRLVAELGSPGAPDERIAPISYIAFWRALRRHGLHPHRLRHAFATAAISRGFPFPIVSRLLGHRQLSTTERYFRPDLLQFRW